MSFHCPTCDAKTQVTSTRAELRERRCNQCGLKFRTEEIEYDGKMVWERRSNAKEETLPYGNLPMTP